MRLPERSGEVVDLLGEPGLLTGRLAGAVTVLKALAARGHEVLLPLADRCL